MSSDDDFGDSGGDFDESGGWSDADGPPLDEVVTLLQTAMDDGAVEKALKGAEGFESLATCCFAKDGLPTVDEDENEARCTFLIKGIRCVTFAPPASRPTSSHAPPLPPPPPRALPSCAPLSAGTRYVTATRRCPSQPRRLWRARRVWGVGRAE